MSHAPGRSPVDGPVALAVRAAMLGAVITILGCSAPGAGSTGIAGASESPPAPPTSSPSAPSASAPAASPDAPSAVPTPEASYPDPTPMPSASPAPVVDAGIRTFPVSADGNCDGMTVRDPLTLTLDLSQQERDAAMLTDRSDWNVHVVWPDGFTVTGSGDDRALLDDRGKVVGRTGDDVTIPATVIFPAGDFDRPIVAEGVLFGRCHRRAVEFARGSVVRTTDQGLRLRSAPGTSSASSVIHAGLPTGTSLYVLDGPVSDDGYDWYRVEWLDATRPLPAGWVAAADVDGRAFLAAADLVCPPRPSRPSEVARLAYGYAVGCFAGQPLTLRARLVACECDPTAPMQPSWLMPDYGPDGPWLLIDPGNTGPSRDYADDLFLIRHPDSPSPDGWGGSTVLVTGMFDHPDAVGCAISVGDGPPSPRDCSGMFVVTGMSPT